MLKCLQARYSVKVFYTHAGCTLVALNPFQPIPDLYSLDVMKEYHCAPQPQVFTAVIQPTYVYFFVGFLIILSEDVWWCKRWCGWGGDIALQEFGILRRQFPLHFIRQLYFCQQESKPHIFIVAEEAYRNVQGQVEPVNQSLVVSGESGAGKVTHGVNITYFINQGFLMSV